MTAGMAVGAAMGAGAFGGEQPMPPAGKVPTRQFGKTGVEVSILGIGGGGRGRNPQIKGAAGNPKARALAEKIINQALDMGINYIDTCAGYGASEEILGHTLKDRRKDVFLVTKCNRPAVPRDQLMRELDQSLKRMKTDRVDAWLIDNLTTMAQVDQIFKKGFAIEAFQRAKEQSLTRFIGISGHASAKVLDATVQRCCKEGVDMDAIMLGINCTDSLAGGHGNALIDKYADSGIALVAMKVFGSDGAPLLRGPAVSAESALRYVLSRPVATAVVGMHTLAELKANVRIARELKPMSAEERKTFERNLAGRVKPMWALKA